MNKNTIRAATSVLGIASFIALTGVTVAAPSPQADAARAKHARVVEHWTAERIAGAIPRDLVIDERGFGYLKKPNGTLEPYGHTVAASVSSQKPMGKPGGGDTSGPSVTGMDPAANATIGASYTFKANVTDASGVRSVTFKVGPKGSRQQSFTASGNGSLYTVQLSGFSNGQWTWNVVAKDNANNTTTTNAVEFTVNTSGGGGGGGGGIVSNAEYTAGGPIQNAVGRIYFEMPDNVQRTRWSGYVCSGTVVSDTASGRSIVQTAAHCVYDDANKAFARNVLFIPNQAGTTGSGTDLNCSNDPLGCWTPRFGVVDVNWTTRTFPDNVAWDYAYYVVDDSDAHTGTSANAQLDAAVTPIQISFQTPFFQVANSSSDYTTALGYSYSDDPNFMYCAQDMTQLDQANWWLGSCDLSGGSSGGPWMQPFANGTGSLISVNSWGYTSQPGMAGPKLSGTSAQCVFDEARTGNATTTTDGDEGIPKSCP
jgi:hypothetical protein